jgi:hypothetical protein
MKSELSQPTIDRTVDFDKSCLVEYTDTTGITKRYVVLVSPKSKAASDHNFTGTVVYSENTSMQIGDIHDTFGKHAFKLFIGKVGLQN